MLRRVRRDRAAQPREPARLRRGCLPTRHSPVASLAWRIRREKRDDMSKRRLSGAGSAVADGLEVNLAEFLAKLATAGYAETTRHDKRRLIVPFIGAFCRDTKIRTSGILSSRRSRRSETTAPKATTR
jgi:hypothetical protein